MGSGLGIGGGGVSPCTTFTDQFGITHFIPEEPPEFAPGSEQEATLLPVETAWKAIRLLRAGVHAHSLGVDLGAIHGWNTGKSALLMTALRMPCVQYRLFDVAGFSDLSLKDLDRVLDLLESTVKCAPLAAEYREFARH